jgi:hypothetical protein
MRFPFNAKFDMPEYYGFGRKPKKIIAGTLLDTHFFLLDNEVRNVKIQTSDNITLGNIFTIFLFMILY